MKRYVTIIFLTLSITVLGSTTSVPQNTSDFIKDVSVNANLLVLRPYRGLVPSNLSTPGFRIGSILETENLKYNLSFSAFEISKADFDFSLYGEKNGVDISDSLFYNRCADNIKRYVRIYNKKKEKQDKKEEKKRFKPLVYDEKSLKINKTLYVKNLALSLSKPIMLFECFKLEPFIGLEYASTYRFSQYRTFFNRLQISH